MRYNDELPPQLDDVREQLKQSCTAQLRRSQRYSLVSNPCEGHTHKYNPDVRSVGLNLCVFYVDAQLHFHAQHAAAIITARCTIVQARSCDCMSSVCLSVTLVDSDHNHIGWKSWNLIALTTPTYSHWNMGNFWETRSRWGRLC